MSWILVLRAPPPNFKLIWPAPARTAFVVVAPAAASRLKSEGGQAEQKLVDELKKYVTDNKIRYKALAEVEFLEAIPKTPSGKLLRKDRESFIAFVRVEMSELRLRLLTMRRVTFLQCEPCTRSRSRSAARSCRISIPKTGRMFSV